MSTITQATEAEIERQSQGLRALVEAVERVIVGQQAMVEGLVIGLLTGGHVLIEGVPGLAKTLTVSAMARGIRADFSRIQFTPDLLPADLVGTLIYNPREATFQPRKGPIFANFVLADEVNRAPPKVQSALLEAMQERQVTIGDETYPLPKPFLVLATMNPIEHEGTYSLPEAQVDRFMLKLNVSYPTRDEERTIVERMAQTSPQTTIEPVVSTDEILAARKVVDAIHVDARVRAYVVDLVRATRTPKDVGLDIERLIEYGASPRASINLILAARAHAFLRGRGYVSPSDVKAVAMDVLRHRVIVSYEAEAEDVTSERLIEQILGVVPVP